MGDDQRDAVWDVVCRIAASTACLNGHISGIGRFTAAASANDHDVCYGIPDVPHIKRLHEQLCAALAQAGVPDQSRFPQYVPHIALIDVPPGEDAPEMDITGTPLHFSGLVLAHGDVQRGVPFANHRYETPMAHAEGKRGNLGALLNYWHGAMGGGQGKPGDYNNCVSTLSKHPKISDPHGLCQWLHIKSTGHPAGHAPGEVKKGGELMEENRPYWFSDYTAKQRRSMGKTGVALPDGSFPIPDIAHLKKALHRIGSATKNPRSTIIAHIRRRARALGGMNLLGPKTRPSDAKAANELHAAMPWARFFFAGDGESDDAARTPPSSPQDDWQHGWQQHGLRVSVGKNEDNAIYPEDHVTVETHDHYHEAKTLPGGKLQQAYTHTHSHSHKEGQMDHEGIEHGHNIMASDPDQSDLHVDGVGGSAKRGRSNAFLTKAHAIVTGMFKAKGSVSKAEFQSAIRQAAGYAGGISGTAKATPIEYSAENPNPIDGVPLPPAGGTGDNIFPLSVQVVAGEERVVVPFLPEKSFHLMPDDTYCPHDPDGDGDIDYLPVDLFGLGFLDHDEPGESDGDMQQAYRDVADLCASKFSDGHVDDPEQRLFIPIQKFVEPPEWMPYLPKPGSYKHPRWGTIRITPERNQHFVHNFSTGVYQTQLPIDGEHMTKQVGALAWVKGMRQNNDGSVDAKMEWTPRGEKALRENTFKYVSPEWYDEWTDPIDDGKITHKDVAIGGALTTRPWYKEQSLRSLVASEDGIQIIASRGGAGGRNIMADERQFAELQEQLRQANERAEAAETASKAASEIVQSLVKEGRHKRFTDEVMGRSDENGTRWYGEAEKHVSFMEQIADSFGEDSDLLKQYVEQNRAHSEQLRHSDIFRERGRNGVGMRASASVRFNEMVKSTASSDGISEIDAMEKVAREHPDLYQQHREASTVITKSAPSDE